MHDPNIAHAAFQVGQAAEVLAQEIAGYHATWAAVLKPRLINRVAEGVGWEARHGETLKDKVSGFGPTPAHALLAFQTAMLMPSGEYTITQKPPKG